MAFDPEAYVSSVNEIDPESVMPQLLAAAQAQAERRMDAAMQELQEQDRKAAEAVKAQVDLMTEARIRFAKAALYEQIIEGALFESDDPVTLEVEAEFKEFAQEQLMILLGIQPNKKKVEALLDEEELNVIKAFAGRLLGRNTAIPKPATPPAAPEKPKTPTLITRPAPAPSPTAPTLAPPKRGRGRPPGTGKNQRAQVAAQLAAQQAAAKPLIAPPSAPSVATRSPVFSPPPVAPNAKTRTVVLPNGDKREVPVSTKTQASDHALRPKPMPSEDEMVAIAMQQGSLGFKESALGKEVASPPTKAVVEG